MKNLLITLQNADRIGPIPLRIPGTSITAFPDSSIGHHTATISLEDYLKAAQAIARGCAGPGCVWYVAKIEEAKEEPKTIESAVPERTTAPEMVAACVAAIGGAPDISASTPFFMLKSIALSEGVRIDGLKGSRAYYEAIVANRLNKAQTAVAA